MDALLKAFSIDLFYDLLDYIDAVSGKVIDVLGTGLVESWLDKQNNAIIFSAPRNSHHGPFKHRADLFRLNLICSVLQPPFDPRDIHLSCFILVEVTSSEESNQLVSVQVVRICDFFELIHAAGC